MSLSRRCRRPTPSERNTIRHRTNHYSVCSTLNSLPITIGSLMDINEFRKIIHHATKELVEYGYHIQKESPIYLVEFGKVVSIGVLCIIGFQPLHVPEIDMFQITLIRRRMKDFPVEETNYKPLYIDLRNFMLGFYKKNIFPPKQYDWKFTDEASLMEQVANAQLLVVEYGIKWLEDPKSNVDWVRNRGAQNSQEG